MRQFCYIILHYSCDFDKHSIKIGVYFKHGIHNSWDFFYICISHYITPSNMKMLRRLNGY